MSVNLSEELVERVIKEISSRPGSNSTNSRFHKIFVLLLAFNFGIPCIFMYGFGFFELMPALKCEGKACKVEDVCQKGLNFEIDYSNEFTLHNWITKYKLICISKGDLALYGSLLLLGFFIGSILFVRLGDSIGRKPIVLTATIVSTVSLFLCLCASPNPLYLYLWIFLFGLTIAPRCLLSYVLAAELTPKKTQGIYTSIAMFVDSICMMGLGAYFMMISRDMDGLLWGMFIVQVVVCVGIAWGVPESPKYLYEKGKR
jgi:hypothetical protein